MTYIFSPSGPSAGSGGTISGMVTGTSHTVVAGTGNCASAPSNPFSNSTFSAPAAPAITTALPTCTSDGTSLVSNYNGTLTYTFTPVGPSVGAGGAISGMVTGTSYTVLANDGTCTSNPSASFSNAAQYPTPVVSVSSSDADSTICAGDNVVFTASPSGIANYDFLMNGVSVQNGPGNTYATSALANGNNISVIPTSSNGCAGNSTNSISFTVNPIPSVSLLASDDSICPGNNLTFTATPAGNDAYEFFDGTSSLQNSSLSSYSTTSLINGNNITVVATDLGCSSPSSNALSVYVYPAPSISLSSTDADSSICAGDTVIFTASPSGYNTYQFSVNGTQVQSSSSNIFVSGSLADNDIVSAIALDFGCPSILSSIVFTVAPFATVNAGNDAVICAGSPHTLSGTIGGSATSNSWTTSGSGSFDNATLTNATYTPSSTDTAAGSILLTITTNDPDGTGPCPAVNDIVLLTINPEAKASAGADAVICADTTLLLNGAINGSATTGTWTTSGNGTFNNSSLATATYSPSLSDIAAGSVILTITTDDPDAGGPCPTESDAMTLTINPVPVASVTASSTTICLGDSVTFSASPQGMDNYNFFVNGVSVQDTPGSTFTSTTISNSDSITVVIRNLGCNSSPGSSLNITVNPIPIVNLNGSTTEICQGDSIIFTASPPGFDSYLFLRYNGNLTPMQNGASETFIPSPSDISDGNVFIVIATDLNCPSLGDSITVSVNPLPNVSIAGDDDICNGESTTISASGGMSYVWDNGSTNNSIAVSPLSKDTFYVTATDVNGCKNSAYIIIKVSQVNSVSAGSDVFVCNGVGVQMNATPGFLSYLWTPSAGLSNPNIANPIVNPDSVTTYLVQFTDANNCNDTASVTVTPSNAFADAGEDVTINYGQENPLAASGGTQYQWSPSAGLNCANCQNPMAGPFETTLYTLIVTNDDGCTDMDSVTVEVIIPVEVFVPEAFSPNNDGENDMLYVRGAAIAELSFAVYDRWGEKVFTTTDKKAGWDGTIKGRDADAAVYVYVLYAKIVNGFEVRKKGDITLIR